MKSIIGEIFPNDVITKQTYIHDIIDPLYPEENNIINNAIDKRIAEFRAGRICAKQALSELEVINFPVLQGIHREPLWPNHIVGSLSHCHDLCGVCISLKDNYLGIGLDVENIKQLNPKIMKHVCTDSEKKWLLAIPENEFNIHLLILFSLKESIYKCVYQAIDKRLKFKDASIKLNIEANSVEVQITENNCSSLQLNCKFNITTTHIFTSAYIKSD